MPPRHRTLQHEFYFGLCGVGITLDCMSDDDMDPVCVAPHRCWPDFAFNQLFPLIIIGGAMALCHFAVESREIPLINIFK